MGKKKVFVRGKKITSRPPWALAGTAGLITLMVLAAFSGGATSADSPKVKPKKASTKRTSVYGGLAPARGFRGYAIRTNAADGTLELAGEGDRIDVIVSFPAGPDGEPVTLTVIGGVRILRIDAGRRLAVVEITPAEAEKLAFSEANGEIRLSLCPAGPDAAIPGKGATFADM